MISKCFKFQPDPQFTATAV